MHESFSKKKRRKGRAFNREILIRQESGADFDSVYDSEKVMKCPEARVRFRVTFCTRTLSSTLGL